MIEFNIHSGNQEVFRFQDYCYEKDCSWLQINEIIEGPLGYTYMATGAGILVFPDNQLTNPYRFFLEDSTSYSNWIKCIAPDGEGLLWVGTNTGLWQVSVEGLEDSSIHSQLMLPSSYLDSYIRDIEVSQTSRTIWIAGENGVSAYEKHSGKSYSLPKIFEEVSFVKLDADETHLWGSTVGRVFVYDVLDSTFKYFNHFDGLNSEYIGNASKSSNDLYIFGSNQGFTHINLAESFSKWRNSPRVCFTRYETKGQSYFINPQTRQAGLKFLPGDDYFTIYFSTLDFAKEGKTYYSYRLTGFDEDWIDINDRNSISYSNLRQGSYSLEVRSSYDGIKWNPQIARIDLEIVPPLWQRTWFQFISVFALSLGIAFWYFQRERQRKARERILEQKVNQKTEDLKRSEQLLERKNQELTKYIESNMQLENFAYLASHDLKSPLQNIINFSQLIERTLANENRPQINMAIQYLNEGAMRMKHTVEDLLNFSLVTNNQINPKWINPEELIEAVLQDISETITQSQAEVSIKSVPKSIPVDESLFRELILNLLTNAIKFVSENSIPKIVISGSTKGSYHNFSVTDNGIGIAKTHKEKIFGIFKRLHSREEYNGTGIGLAICKKIVERHDGKIWVESLGEGMGSTFFFSFPIFPAKKIKDARQRELVSP
ncbi:MAG: ATP-binding protein [Bacteroidota bacterium]